MGCMPRRRSGSQFVDQREEPCAVRVEQVGAHDEHVEHVTAGRGHAPVEHGNVFGSLRHEDVPHNVQMGSIERVRIVRVHRLDIVVPTTGHDCAGLFQRFPNLLTGCDSNESVFSQSVRETGGRKQPAVVHEAFVVGVAVLPHPVQGRQFGIACVEARDVIALVVSLDAGQHVRVQGRADVERQVRRVVGRAVRLVHCDCYADRLAQIPRTSVTVSESGVRTTFPPNPT